MVNIILVYISELLISKCPSAVIFYLTSTKFNIVKSGDF